MTAEMSSSESEQMATLRELFTNRSFLLVWAGRNFYRLGDSIHEVALA